jgi:hypothetical protein
MRCGRRKRERSGRAAEAGRREAVKSVGVNGVC